MVTIIQLLSTVLEDMRKESMFNIHTCLNTGKNICEEMQKLSEQKSGEITLRIYGYTQIVHELLLKGYSPTEDVENILLEYQAGNFPNKKLNPQNNTVYSDS